MSSGTNVGTVYFSIELDNQAKIKKVVSNTMNDVKRQVSAQSASVEKATASASNGIGSLIKKIGLATVAIMAMRKAFNFGKEAVALASDLQEVQNVVDVTFGSASSKVDAFAKTAMSSIGLSEKVTKQYMGSFGAMSKAFGFSTDEAYNMAEALTRLSGDVASFYNMSSDMAYTKLKSVFTGETESLKDLGVVMTQSALDNYAMQQGINKTTSAMTEQEKTLLRYKFVMDQLSLAQGDFIRTQDGWANQVRVLKLRFDELKATIGEGLIVALIPVIKFLNLLISKLTIAAQAFTKFMKSLFGIKDSGNSASTQFSSEMAAAGASTSAVASNTAQTAKNLAKANRQLMGFDKLYKLSDNSSSASADLGDTGVGGVTTTSVPTASKSSGLDLSNFKLPSAAELGKKLSNIIVGSLKFIRDKLKSIDWSGIGKSIGEFLKAVDWTAIFVGVVEVIFAAMSAAFDLWKGAFNAAPLETAIITAVALLKFTPLGAIVAAAIRKSIIAKLGADSGATLGQAIFGWLKRGIGSATKLLGGIGLLITGLGTAVTSFIDMLKKGFSWFKEVLMVIGLAIAAVGAVLLGVPATVAAVVAAIIAALATLVVVIKENWEAIKAWLSEAWTNISNFFTNVWESVTTFITNTFNAISEFFVNAYNKVTEFFASVINSIATFASNVWNSIVTWFSNLLNSVKTFIVNIGNSITGGLKSIINYAKSFGSSLGNTLKGAWNSVTGWFTSSLANFRNYFVNIFVSIKNGVRDAFNSLATAIKTPINYIIRSLNKMINGINKLQFKLPNWVPGIGGKSLGFNIPNIPMLADGGYVKPNNPRLAVIGDNKREGEIVAPESKITEAVNKAMTPLINAIMGAMRGSQTTTSNGEIVIPIYIGNELLDQYIANANTKNVYRSGR